MPQTDYSGCDIISREYESALHQIGTLGGGNHFIEIQNGSDDLIWVMIHSGSRNLGKKVADYYNKIAVGLNGMWFSQVEKSKELAFLPIESNDAKNYLREMQYCVDFAFASRGLMMARIMGAFIDVIPGVTFPSFNGAIITNIAHNYARFENHFGHDVIVHRKGATSARFGEIGIIPGSMGTKSYITTGVGNPDSFSSCSHGAGRKMGRGRACKELSLVNEVAQMDAMGIIHGLRVEKDLDEAPGAYKDIDVVMENQKDLVDILVELKPLGVIKG
jgi:tRNA-splicing ligase RtcB